MNSAPEPSAAQRLVGDIAPKLAELTDEVLFGDVCTWPSTRGGRGRCPP